MISAEGWPVDLDLDERAHRAPTATVARAGATTELRSGEPAQRAPHDRDAPVAGPPGAPGSPAP